MQKWGFISVFIRNLNISKKDGNHIHKINYYIFGAKSCKLVSISRVKPGNLSMVINRCEFYWQKTWQKKDARLFVLMVILGDAFDEILHPFGGCFFHFICCVSVNIESKSDGRMAEVVLYGFYFISIL